MCGICGFNFEDKNLIKVMSDLIKHRGPDDFGYFTDNEVSLGVRRLSIIDLKTGNQPQHNEEGDIWIIFNGEIYNFKSLREKLIESGHNFYTDSDTETIIHSYEEWGYNCVQKLQGQFSFCIYDIRKKILFLARDHLGLKPLYYYSEGEKFLFGSEIKCILAQGIKRKVNKRALDLFLSLKYVPQNITMFENVYKIPPATYLIYDLKKKNITLNKYWDFHFNINHTQNENQIAENLKQLIINSVRSRLISDVPLGAFLSGGIDSTAVVAIMSELMDKPVKTFSVKFEKGAPINEAKYARFVSDYYNTEHEELTVKSSSYELLPKLIWHLDDLIADAAIIPIHILAKNAKNNITVALTGDGADELFAGYSVYYRKQRFNFIKYIPYIFIEKALKYYDYIPFHIMKILLTYFERSKSLEDRYIRKIIHIPEREKSDILPFKHINIENLIKSKYIKGLDLINQFTNWDLKYQLPNQFNMKIDKMTMAASLEARLPYLDSKIVQFAATIPPKLKLKGNTEKYILRLAVKDLIPREILKRRKTGFTVPINLWLKTGLKETAGEILEKLQKRNNLIKPNYLKIIKRNLTSQHFQNRVWNLIMFELWYETFIERENLEALNSF